MPPPPLAASASPTATEARDRLGLARSFGMGEARPPAEVARVPGGGLPFGARADAPRVARDERRLDPKLVARVLAAPRRERVAVRASAGVLALDWELGLDAWATAIDRDLAAGEKASLDELLSALHENALLKRLESR
jgi:hypothetical protein